MDEATLPLSSETSHILVLGGGGTELYTDGFSSEASADVPGVVGEGLCCSPQSEATWKASWGIGVKQVKGRKPFRVSFVMEKPFHPELETNVIAKSPATSPPTGRRVAAASLGRGPPAGHSGSCGECICSVQLTPFKHKLFKICTYRGLTAETYGA